MFDEHKEIYLFFRSPPSEFSSSHTKGVNNQSENRKLNKEILVSRKVYFSQRL